MLSKMPMWSVNVKICLHQLGIMSYSQRQIPPVFQHFTGDKTSTLCMFKSRHARGQSVSIYTPEHIGQLSCFWKYFSSCWIPSHATMNGATLVTDHFPHLGLQWGVNISELMHKTCTSVFLSAVVVRHNSWVFLSMEEHGLVSVIANGKCMEIFNA